jgi:hypothetical protein
MSSPPVHSEVRVSRSLVFCVVLCRSLFVFLSFLFWSLFCLSLLDLRFLISLLVIVLSVPPRFTVSDFSVGHCFVCPSTIYGFCFLFWSLYCLSFFFWSLYCLSFFFWSLYCLSFFVWSLYCLSFYDLRLLITPFLFSTFSFQHNNTIKVDINVCSLNC